MAAVGWPRSYFNYIDVFGNKTTARQSRALARDYTFIVPRIHTHAATATSAAPTNDAAIADGYVRSKPSRTVERTMRTAAVNNRSSGWWRKTYIYANMSAAPAMTPNTSHDGIVSTDPAPATMIPVRIHSQRARGRRFTK